MAYFQISKWSGLDTRRSELTSQPGTLETFQNAHINQGGEIEKRKAFPRTQIPANTFGFQETTTGIDVFGSRLKAWTSSSVAVFGPTFLVTVDSFVNYPVIGDSITITGSSQTGLNGTFVVTGTSGNEITFNNINGVAFGSYTDAITLSLVFPAPISYIQLVNPTGANMTGVLSSTYFNNTPFAVTTWDNGDVLAFYGTEQLKDFTTGLQNNITPNPYTMAEDLVAQINATGLYTAAITTALVNLTVQVTGGSAGATYSVDYDFNRQVVLTPYLTTNVAEIAISVAYTTNLNATATAIAAAITAATDAYAGGPGTSLGFTAVAAGSIVTITSPVGINAGDVLITVVTGTGVLYVPPISTSFSVSSISSQSTTNPFSVATVLDNIGLTYQLVSNGTLATAPASAVGQVTLITGTSNASSTGVITVSGTNFVPNATLTLGGTTYTATTVLTGTANEFLIASTAALTLANLVSAINASLGSGSTYSINTVANTSASAAAVSGSATTLTATKGGTQGNTIVLTTTSANVTLAPFASGGPDTNQITQIAVGGVNLLAAYVVFDGTVNQTVNDLVAAINAFQGTSGYTASANAGVISLVAKNTGASYNQALISVTSAGDVCFANCYFLVTGTGNISGITANGTALMTATITFQSSGFTTETLAGFCGRVVANINANTGISKYLACNTGNQINISSAIVASNQVPVDIEVTATMSIASAATNALAAVPSASTVTFYIEAVPSANSTILYTQNNPNSVLMNVTGGTPPYKYTWSTTAQPQTINIVGAPAATLPIASPQISSIYSNNQWWSITFTYRAGGSASGTQVWFCTVTDSASPANVVIVPIYLAYNFAF